MNQHNDREEQLKATQSELAKLALRQLELQKQQQLQEREKQKTMYQQLFGQQSLPEDPEVILTLILSLLQLKRGLST
jgi:hypothetical protein